MSQPIGYVAWKLTLLIGLFILNQYSISPPSEKDNVESSLRSAIFWVDFQRNIIFLSFNTFKIRTHTNGPLNFYEVPFQSVPILFLNVSDRNEKVTPTRHLK